MLRKEEEEEYDDMDRKWIMVDNQVTKGEVRMEHIMMTRSQGEGDQT